MGNGTFGATGKVFCHPFRYTFDELAAKIQAETGLPLQSVMNVVSAPNFEPTRLTPTELEKLGMNHPKDNWGKLTPNEKKDGVDPKKTISTAEAARFIWQMFRFLPMVDPETHPKAKMLKSLINIYFGNSPMFEKRPGGTPNGEEPHETKPIKFYIKVDERDPYCSKDGCFCHDFDTCNITEYVPSECFDEGFLGYRGATREAQIDAPERGEIPDDNGTVSMVLKYFETAAFDATPSVFVNKKLVENSVKALRYLVVQESSGLSKKEIDAMSEDQLIKLSNKLLMGASTEDVFLATQIASIWIDYSGTITLPLANGIVYFMENEAKKLKGKDVPQAFNITPVTKGLELGTLFYLRETTVRYTAEDTPIQMCGMKNMYDVYLRRLMTNLVAHPVFLKRYLEEVAAKDIETFDSFYKVHERYKAKLASRTALLKKSENKALVALAEKLSADKLYSPSQMYSKDKMMEVVTKFFNEHEGYLKDQAASWNLFKVLLGWVYAYQKYRTNDFVAYRDAQEHAIEAGTGFTSIDPVFMAVWNYNKKIERYFPKDCLTGEK
jgi:hypothetical protein